MGIRDTVAKMPDKMQTLNLFRECFKMIFGSNSLSSYFHHRISASASSDKQILLIMSKGSYNEHNTQIYQTIF